MKKTTTYGYLRAFPNINQKFLGIFDDLEGRNWINKFPMPQDELEEARPPLKQLIALLSNEKIFYTTGKSDLTIADELPIKKALCRWDPTAQDIASYLEALSKARFPWELHWMLLDSGALRSESPCYSKEDKAPCFFSKWGKIGCALGMGVGAGSISAINVLLTGGAAASSVSGVGLLLAGTPLMVAAVVTGVLIGMVISYRVSWERRTLAEKGYYGHLSQDEVSQHVDKAPQTSSLLKVVVVLAGYGGILGAAIGGVTAATLLLTAAIPALGWMGSMSLIVVSAALACLLGAAGLVATAGVGYGLYQGVRALYHFFMSSQEGCSPTRSSANLKVCDGDVADNDTEANIDKNWGRDLECYSPNSSLLTHVHSGNNPFDQCITELPTPTLKRAQTLLAGVR